MTTLCISPILKSDDVWIGVLGFDVGVPCCDVAVAMELVGGDDRQSAIGEGWGGVA